MDFPDWVKEYQTEGYEIVFENDKYYLYAVDPSFFEDAESEMPDDFLDDEIYLGELEMPDDVSMDRICLGVITPDGFVPLDEPPEYLEYDNIDIKSYGFFPYLSSITKDIRKLLSKAYDDPITADSIYVMSLFMVMNCGDISILESEYEHSFVSQEIPNLNFSDDELDDLIYEIGNEENINKFMKKMYPKSDNIIIDGSEIFSTHKKMRLGNIYLHGHSWEPELNMIFMFSTDPIPDPLFFSCFEGTIPKVSDIQDAIKAQHLKTNYTFLADADFGSDSSREFLYGHLDESASDSFKLLESNKFNYIIPLTRSAVDDSDNELMEAKGILSSFVYNDNLVIAKELDKGKYRIIIYNDAKTESDKSEYSFYDRLQHSYIKPDNITFRTNVKGTPEKIFETYLLRFKMETHFDKLKSYFQDNSDHFLYLHEFQAWGFISCISIIIYNRITRILENKGLTNKYTFNDLLFRFNAIKKFKLGNSSKWYTTNPSKALIKLCSELGFDLDREV